MSSLNFFLPGWSSPPTPIPEERQLEAMPVSDSADWSFDAANDASRPRYGDYCDKKYDDPSEHNRLADG